MSNPTRSHLPLRLISLGAGITLLLGGVPAAAAATELPEPTPKVHAAAPSEAGDPRLEAALQRATGHGRMRALDAGTPLVEDFHADALGDMRDLGVPPDVPPQIVPRSPELTGAGLVVYPEDPVTQGDDSSVLVIVSTTDAQTLSGDWSEVWLDTTGDEVDDYRIISPAVYMDQDAGYMAPIEWNNAGTWTTTGEGALVVRFADGYGVAFDWRALGLTSVRFITGLVDEPGLLWDQAPDDYSGGLVSLPQPAAPSAPQAASAVPGDGSATVSWAAPAAHGTALVTGYTVVANPGGASCSTAGLSCVVGGLSNQQPYTFSVVAVSAHGQSAPTVTGAVVPQPFVQIKLKARRSGNVLYVDVNPNLKKKRYWRFRVEKQQPTGWVLMPKTYRTSGSKETRTLNFKKGTYRVVVLADYGYQQTTSPRTVYLKK